MLSEKGREGPKYFGHRNLGLNLWPWTPTVNDVISWFIIFLQINTNTHDHRIEYRSIRVKMLADEP